MKKRLRSTLIKTLELCAAAIQAAGVAAASQAEFDNPIGSLAAETPLAKPVEIASAQTAGEPSQPAPDARPRRTGRGFGGPIVLGPDDVAAFDDPPAGIATVRDGVPRGKIEMIEYESQTVCTTLRS